MHFKAEIFDQVQRLFDLNGFNDHQLHCVLCFEAGAGPDPKILGKAVLASIAAIPILGTRFVDGARPCWERLDRAEFARAFIVAHDPAGLDAVLLSRSDEERGPQVKVCLLDADPAAMAITLNHMICDAAGFKAYVYFVCGLYSALSLAPNHSPGVIDGDRGLHGVLAQFGAGARLKSLFSENLDNNQTGDRRFPMGNGEADAPFISTRRLARERTAEIKAFGRAQGATLNDMALTALYRALFPTLEMHQGESLAIPIMVDMRRYLLKDDAFACLTNLSSMMATELDYRPDESFAATLSRVKAEMDRKKEGDIGLNAFVKLDLIYSVFGDRIANRFLRKRLKNPLICMTNIGVLDEARLSFAGAQPSDAFMCGSIKYKPYFQLALSTYRDEVTFSVNLYGSPVDRVRVEALLDGVEAQLS